MIGQLQICLMLISPLLATKLDKIELPPCPQNLQHSPQELPMHCRMTRNADPTAFGLPDNLQPVVPFQLPPRLPLPMPMPMPPIPAGPPHKMPVIVMPFYSADHHGYRTKRPPKGKGNHHHKDTHTSSDSNTSSAESDDSSDSDESGDAWWKIHKKKKNHKKKYDMVRRSNKHHRMKNKPKELLTPILQYVTKDGYVIFEKKISKDEANDWLGPNEEVKLNNNEMNNNKHLMAVEAEIPTIGIKVDSDVLKQENQGIKRIKIKKVVASKEVNEIAEDKVKEKEKPRKKHKTRKVISPLQK